MATWTDYVLGPAIVLTILGLATLTLLQDAGYLTGDLWTVLVVFDARVLVLVAAGIFGLSFLLYLYYLSTEDATARVTEGRSVEAIVPVYNDAAVMHTAVEHLLAADYEPLTVTLACEPDDAASIERAAALSETHSAVRYVLNERTGSKAGAINTVLEDSDADVIALFDADQQVHPQFLPHAMAYLDEYDIARGRSLPRPNGGVFEAMIYYEYLVLFFLPQKLARFALDFNFAGSRTILLDRSVFDEIGTFREDALTEDLDFTHRCHEAGLSIRELLYYPCSEESAHTLRDWWGQRMRWMRGQVEVSHGRLQNWRSLFGRSFLGSLVTSLGTFVAGTLMAITVPKLAIGLLTSPLVVGGGLAAIFATLIATRYVDTRTAGLEGFGIAWLLLPVTVTLYGVVIIQVVFEYALGIESDWYQVEKVDTSA